MLDAIWKRSASITLKPDSKYCYCLTNTTANSTKLLWSSWKGKASSSISTLFIEVIMKNTRNTMVVQRDWLATQTESARGVSQSTRGRRKRWKIIIIFTKMILIKSKKSRNWTKNMKKILDATNTTEISHFMKNTGKHFNLSTKTKTRALTQKGDWVVRYGIEFVYIK